jgi:hybrid cluster-associated redox disulfide protein
VNIPNLFVEIRQGGYPHEECTMITQNMIIADIIRSHPETLPVFQQFKLDCYECQIADLETLEHGAGVHKVAIAELLEALNNSVK